MSLSLVPSTHPKHLPHAIITHKKVFFPKIKFVCSSISLPHFYDYILCLDEYSRVHSSSQIYSRYLNNFVFTSVWHQLEFFGSFSHVTLHKKWSFPLGISFQFPADLFTFTKEILHGKLHFLYSFTHILKGRFSWMYCGRPWKTNFTHFQKATKMALLTEKNSFFVNFH